MNRTALALAGLAALTVLVAPLAHAADDPGVVQLVAFNLFQPVDVSHLALSSEGCLPPGTQPSTPSPPQGTITLDGQGGFRWAEAETAGGQALPPGAPVPASYLSESCARVSFNVTLPAGADHVHLRFSATREVDCNPAGYCPDFRQELILSGSDPKLGVVYEFYNVTEAAHVKALDIDAPAYHGAGDVRASWFFQEVSSGANTPLVAARPGLVRYASHIGSPVLEFSLVPAPHAVNLQERGSGSSVLRDYAVGVDVASLPQGGGWTDVQMRFDPSMTYTSLRTPDGTVLEGRPTTREHDGPHGWDRSKVLLERNAQYAQLTIPGEILRAHGTGTYTLTETQTLDIQAVPALIPLAAFLLLLPFPFAAIAVRQARAFEKEAFGGLRRSAANLRYALGAVTLYYLAVVGAALLAGGIDTMTRFPIGLTGIFLYLQLVLASLAFVALYLVARELYRITVPAASPPAPIEEHEVVLRDA